MASSRIAQGALGGAAFLAYSSVNVVEPGYRGVVYSRFSGVWNYSVAEGSHFLIPWVRPPPVPLCRVCTSHWAW
jgi:regulator of protease activity HflC (stomatin/prohibitin superfamily)